MKSQKFKAMYEAKLEFPEGWRRPYGKSLPWEGGGGGGMDIFWNHTFVYILFTEANMQFSVMTNG